MSSEEFWEGFTEDTVCDLNLEKDFNRFGGIMRFDQRKACFLLRRQEGHVKV